MGLVAEPRAPRPWPRRRIPVRVSSGGAVRRFGKRIRTAYVPRRPRAVSSCQSRRGREVRVPRDRLRGEGKGRKRTRPLCLEFRSWDSSSKPRRGPVIPPAAARRSPSYAPAGARRPGEAACRARGASVAFSRGSSHSGASGASWAYPDDADALWYWRRALCNVDVAGGIWSGTAAARATAGVRHRVRGRYRPRRPSRSPVGAGVGVRLSHPRAGGW
jgi:hypothetical protein